MRDRLNSTSVWILTSITIIWAYTLLIPHPAVIEDKQAGGVVFFAANRRVLFPGHCATLSWQVDNIDSVYLNDEPQIGQGTGETCLTGEIPRLTVFFRDGSQQTYHLPLVNLLPSPLTTALVATALAAGFLSWHSLRNLIRQPPRLLFILTIAVVNLVLFVGYLLPLSDTVASGSWIEASNALAAIISGGTLIAVLSLISGAVVTVASPNPGEFTLIRQNLLGWSIGLVTAAGVVVGTIVTANPLGMYFTTDYPSPQLLLRGIKTDNYNRLPAPPDLLVMGSSRAFTLSPAYITRKTGYTAYNMAIEGGRIEDILIQVRQMQSFPDVLLIEAQDGLPRQANDIAARAPLRWLPYMSFSTALLTLQKRLEGLLDINQLSQAIYTARYARVLERQPKEWPEFDTGGFAVRPLISAAQLEHEILLDIGNIPPLRCHEIDAGSQVDITELIRIAQNHGTALVFYTSPWHPRYYDAVLKHDPDYQACHAASRAYFEALEAANPYVSYLDFSLVDSIGGVADESGFYDSQHLTAANSQRLIDHAATTLIAAPARAKQGG